MVHLQILLLDGTQIGKISKKWAGLARELFTDGHYYGITFPLELDVRLKAVLLGACIMIVSQFKPLYKNENKLGLFITQFFPEFKVLRKALNWMADISEGQFSLFTIYF